LFFNCAYDFKAKHEREAHKNEREMLRNIPRDYADLFRELHEEKNEWKIARILPGSAVGHEKQISNISISSRWRSGFLYLLMSSFGAREEEREESPLNKH
jgi:hypothetical protein